MRAPGSISTPSWTEPHPAADTCGSGTFSRFRNRETVTMIPFSSAPEEPRTFTPPERNADPVLRQIRSYGKALQATGGRARPNSRKLSQSP
ncbi:hypothetical protein Skr01_33160 [Sphaerisporangium krabiense]|nr:hypothetical protein Skr01_33160 [Sphaerisporangium krabiense]